MILFLAGAESSLYQDAMLTNGNAILQTFYVVRERGVFERLAERAHLLNHGESREQDDLLVRPDPGP